MILGSPEFIKETLKKLREEYLWKAETAHRRVLSTARIGDEIGSIVAAKYNVSLEDIIEGRERESRKVAIYLFKKHIGMTNGIIGKAFGGLSYSAVTKTCRRLTEEMGKNHRLHTLVNRLVTALSHVKG
jgi:chromosomal replication initiation ATPase DnaA